MLDNLITFLTLEPVNKSPTRHYNLINQKKILFGRCTRSRRVREAYGKVYTVTVRPQPGL